MSELLLIKDFVNASKYNKAEFAYFTGAVISKIKAAGVENLHAPAGKFALFEELYVKMEDLVGISRASQETAKITVIEEDIYYLMRHFLGIVRTGKDVPLADVKEAATYLYDITRPYTKTYRAPQYQKVQTVKGLLTDLNKDESIRHVETLNLSNIIEAITLKQAQYTVLLDSRANTQLKNFEEKTLKLRQQMTDLYHDIVNTIWAFSISDPSEEATNFIISLNKLISDLEAAYNRRKGQSNTVKDEEEPSAEEETNDEQGIVEE